MPDTPTNWGNWGDEERGTQNYVTEDKVARAAKLVETGKVYSLSIPLKAKSPIWPSRHKNWHLANAPGNMRRLSGK